MKNILTGLFFLLSLPVFSQLPYSWLNGNNINCFIENNGVIFQQNGAPAFSSVNHPGIYGILSSGIWVAAKDNAQNIYVAASTYDTSGQDFWPGPIDRTTGLPDDTAYWNYVWYTDSALVETHKVFYDKPSYQAPWNISHWPGSNTRPGNYKPVMAPFIDLNSNGSYQPEEGEVPFIRSDRAAYFILNDAYGLHTTSGGSALGIEIYGMAYSSDEAPVNNTVFVKYFIFNHSSKAYDSVFAGIFTDFMLGNPNDNFISTDTGRDMYICYNGETFDSNGYGANPPAIGVKLLNRSLDKCISIGYGTSNTGWPQTPREHFQYLAGRWRNDQVMMDQSAGLSTSFIFNGNPCAGTGWTEDGSISSSPGRRNALGSVGPLSLSPGQVIELDVAYIFSEKGTTSLDNLCELQNEADDVQEYWNFVLTKNSMVPAKKTINVYPNPVSHTLYFPADGLTGELIITDVQGKVLMQDKNNTGSVNVALWEPGIYFYSWSAQSSTWFGRFVKQ